MRRNALKVLHWTVFPLLLYFFFVEPEHVSRLPDAASKTAALATHAGIGLILAGLVAIWTLCYWRYGQAGRLGPKLSDRAKRFHYWGHRALYWALPITMVTGALAGLAAPFAVMGFGVVPLNIVGDGGLHGAAKEIHEIAFHALTVIAIAHIGFHLWRHYLLKDNALKIMAPKALHRWL